MSKIVKIDLSKYKNKDAKFVVGRDNGEDARKKEKLDDLIEMYNNNEISKIQFITTTYVYGVVSSFILGFLSDIITEINNKEEVYKIFDFGELTEAIQQQFDEEIDYILGV